MQGGSDRPLVIQGDGTVSVDVTSARYEEARDELVVFAELMKTPERVHTYRVTPLSIWNARAAGATADEIIGALTKLSRWPPPPEFLARVRHWASCYGRLTIRRDGSGLVVSVDDAGLVEEISQDRDIAPFLTERISMLEFRVKAADRGWLKQALAKAGYPAVDLAGYDSGERLDVALRTVTRSRAPFGLRYYQREAIDAFYAAGRDRGGAGVVVLPSGAGKTIVGMAAMSEMRASTLIIVTGVDAAKQWRRELLDKTALTQDQIGLYCGSTKDVRPVTITTYRMLTYRRRGDPGFRHLSLFDTRNWGLVIYDEVHLLPAAIFRATANIQARRRLGLTATLVREDGLEGDVFALIGPKRYEAPPKELEEAGWIAAAECIEVRLPLPGHLLEQYARTGRRAQFRIASETPAKIESVRKLLALHPGEPTLVFGFYLDQLREIASGTGVPLVTGQTPQRERDTLYAAFREGRIPVLAVSPVGNAAVDLPDACVAIQVSGLFGSRQEEAQRLGRILRPKGGRNVAHFYSLVTRDSVEQDFAMNRQRFLRAHGYVYRIWDVDDPDAIEGNVPA